jgi:hypothetical protein
MIAWLRGSQRGDDRHAGFCSGLIASAAQSQAARISSSSSIQ